MAIDVPESRINAIVKRQRSITADTDLRLCRFIGLSERFWLRMQTSHDLKLAKQALASVLRGSNRSSPPDPVSVSTALEPKALRARLCRNGRSQAVRPSASALLELRDALLAEPGFAEEISDWFRGLRDPALPTALGKGLAEPD